MILIDDGSTLNVFPLKTASYLGLSIEDFMPSDQHVRAYDNSRREVLGTNTGTYHRANDKKKGGISSIEHSFILQHALWATRDPRHRGRAFIPVLKGLVST